MAQPVARMRSVVLDCPDPRALAEFYAQVLGGTVEGDDDWVDLHVPGSHKLAFQRAPGHKPPEWPRDDADSQQLHLDLDVGDTMEAIEAAEEKVLALGARPLDVNDLNGKRDFRVYADPAGHPFCLCRVERTGTV
ncbi:VOC family protein [Streptomyces sp. NPDC046931]|uniref:VOC family protein n=1 Tax=Streptomyces sp. NPDC046931 TaxID=3154806 RepID=UPI0033F1B069